MVDEGIMELVPDSAVVGRPPFALANLIIVYGLLTMLRWRGLFALHAAAVTPDDRGCLLVGESGTGKSTMTLRLLQEGWSYLSDDSVLLRTGQPVEAVALRRRLTIKREEDVVDMPGSWHRAQTAAGVLLRPAEDGVHQLRRLSTCVPRLLVFLSLTGKPASRITLHDKADALVELIRQSTLTELEPSHTGMQLDLLRDLVNQCRCVWLAAGLDVYREPGALAAILLEELQST